MLPQAREDRVTYWRFSASSVGAVCGNLWLLSHTIASRTKSCMVLTRSKATTNNVQGDEPRITALERQVQTLATTVKRLTKQNHHLEEQLCQKNIGLNTQEEDQEGTSVERRDQERPEGSNTPSRLEWQDTSRSFVTDMAPPHIVVEMQMMKEQMEFMMNALRGQVSSNLDDLVHWIDLPFTASVTSIPLYQNFICRRWRVMMDPRTP